MRCSMGGRDSRMFMYPSHSLYDRILLFRMADMLWLVSDCSTNMERSFRNGVCIEYAIGGLLLGTPLGGSLLGAVR